MIVVNDILTSNIEFEDTYVAIGNFDGVHYGHKKLINETIKAARANSKKAVVFTFEKHPLEFLFSERKFDYINTSEELTIQAEPGRIRIAESACPSQDCVHTGWISRAGQQIICLPDKLVISLSGSGSQEFDAISG